MIGFPIMYYIIIMTLIRETRCGCITYIAISTRIIGFPTLQGDPFNLSYLIIQKYVNNF